jgi:hypothetical protein
MEHSKAKFVSLLTPFRFAGLLPSSGSGEHKVAAENHTLDRKTNTRPAGEHLKRLRKSAVDADNGEGISLRGLSREERRRLLSRAA